jgi:hypothetical protein
VKASAIACRLPRLLLALVGAGNRWPHAEHAPARGPAERKEEQHPWRPDEGVRSVALQTPVGLEVAERERVRVAAALERDPGALADGAVRAVAADQVSRTHLLGAPSPLRSVQVTSCSPAESVTSSTPSSTWMPCSVRCSFSTASVSACKTKSRNE